MNTKKDKEVKFSRCFHYVKIIIFVGNLETTNIMLTCNLRVFTVLLIISLPLHNRMAGGDTVKCACWRWKCHLTWIVYIHLPLCLFQLALRHSFCIHGLRCMFVAYSLCFSFSLRVCNSYSLLFYDSMCMCVIRFNGISCKTL